MSLIATSQELKAFCDRQRGSQYITIDTEFMRDSTYWSKLCLVQVGGPEEARAIDPLAPDLDLAPLIALLDEPSILKVIHAGRQDLEIFYKMNGRLPAPIFDSQIAAMVCGFGDSVGYDTLVAKLVGARVDKSSRFTDWSRRPLNEKQLAYALADVVYLRPVYEKLRAELERSGRSSWLEEEMAILTSPETYKVVPEESWRRLKTRSQDREFLSILKELAAWREIEAQRRDVPRSRVLRDEQIFDLANHRPTTPEELARTRGFNLENASGRLGKEVVESIRRGKNSPPSARPAPEDRTDFNPRTMALVELLKVILKMKCDEHRVAQKLVANTADLEQIAGEAQAEVPAMRGWRYEVFGRHAQALKEGRVAITVQGYKVKLVELESEAGKALRTA